MRIKSVQYVVCNWNQSTIQTTEAAFSLQWNIYILLPLIALLFTHLFLLISSGVTLSLSICKLRVCFWRFGFS